MSYFDIVNNFFERVPYLTSTGRDGTLFPRPRKRVICKDGFMASIQASEYHYCSPRINDAVVYTAVEIGFPSERVDSWMEYIDDRDSDPTETVYGYVPIHLVNEALEAHGGIDYDVMENTDERVE